MTDLQVGDLVRIVRPSFLLESPYKMTHGDTGVVRKLSHEKEYAEVAPVITHGTWGGAYWFNISELLEKIE